MRLTPVLLVAGAGALGVSASANAHSQPHHQSPAHLHDKRTFGLLSGLGFGFGGGSSRPSASWRCDGSGKDGYSVDWLGLGRPFWVPEGWLYFGTSIGWAPPAGWECSASWSIPSLFLNIVHEVTWWQPSDAWIGAHIGVDLGFTAPSWWGMISLPAQGWKCDGSGKDGWSIDWQGKGRPSWAPSGWLWFGSSIGWAPPIGWSCDASWSLPSAFVDVCGSVSWWKPPSDWIDAHIGVDLGFTAPSWWGVISLPSRGWTCDGSGKDGWSIDWQGNGRPSWAPSGWLWFGSSIGWAPPVGWSCGASWSLPSAFVDVCGSVSWWKPPSAWIDAHIGVDLGFTAPSWWGVISLPSRGWTCDGSGKDGWSIDWQGNGRPSWAPSGWLWFGSSIGWAPPVGWSCGASWSLPSAFVDVCGSVSWWKPPSAWIDAHVGVDLGFTAPSWWGVISLPSRGWTCDGSGKDGWSIDWQGNGRPSWAPSGWLWFGGSIGWAPPASWSCSSTWQIPSQWSSVWRVSWWQPGAAWLTYHQKHDFGWSIPSWWGLPSCGCSCGCGAKTSPALSSIVISTTSRAPSTTSPAPSTTSRAPSTTSRPAQTTTSLPTTTSPQKPSTTLKTSSSASCTSSTKAAATTTRKASTTTHKASTTTHKASSSTHKASSTKKVSTTSKKPSTKTSVQATTTYKPSTQTITVTAPGQIVTVTETHNLPPPPAPTSRPGQGWECSGSGDDGWDVDWQGNGCPSHLPSGWKWWGVSIGWGPSKGWDCGSNWTPSPAEVDSCSKTQWWTPPPSLQLPSGVECPAGWISIGWIDQRRPSASWTCDGTGRDGYDFDHFGNGRPSYLPVGWKWFGQLHGWQPCSSFQLPSSTWSPPSSWNPNLAVWWQPRAAWTLRGNFRCPRWWNRGHLRGSFRWW
ncbi:hypothetical protein NBRC10512_003842 [Rhodotorula toruloides]